MAALRRARTRDRRDMSFLPPDTISVHDSQITVDADAVADGLGLTVEELRQEIAEGRVVAVAETGIAEDDGRLRLTFRHGTRIWRIVRLADGSLVDERTAGSKTVRAADRIDPGCVAGSAS